MRVRIAAVALLAVLAVPFPVWAAQSSEATEAASVSEVVRDYQTVRSLGLALAVLAFLTALGRLGTSDAPHERGKAQDLLVKAAVAFVVLAGDRLVAKGVCGWFSMCGWLPQFWQ